MQNQKIEIPEDWFDLPSQEFDINMLKTFGDRLTKTQLSACFASNKKENRKTHLLTNLGYKIFDEKLKIRNYRHELEIPTKLSPRSLSAIKMVVDHLKGPYLYEFTANNLIVYSFNQKESSLLLFCQNNLERFCQLVSP